MKILKREWSGALFAIIFATIGLLGCAKTPYVRIFQPIADNYKAELLYPPRDGIMPGSEFRRKDTLVLRQGCYKGTSKDLPAKVLNISSQTISYDNSADFSVDWKDILGFNVKWSSVGKIDLKLSNFTQDSVTNIVPTFANHCLGGDGYRSSNPIFASLIKIGSIEATFYDKTGKEIKLDLDLGQLKNIVELTPGINAKFSGEKTVSFKGKDVYVIYYKVEPNSNEERKNVSCSIDILCELGVGGYSMVVTDVKSGAATVRLSHLELDEDEFKSTHNLILGRPSIILKHPLRRDVIRLDDTDPVNRKVGILINSTTYSVESGRLFED